MAKSTVLQMHMENGRPASLVSLNRWCWSLTVFDDPSRSHLAAPARRLTQRTIATPAIRRIILLRSHGHGAKHRTARDSKWLPADAIRARRRAVDQLLVAPANYGPGRQKKGALSRNQVTCGPIGCSHSRGTFLLRSARLSISERRS